MSAELRIRRFEDLQDYETLARAMRAFTDERNNDTVDELWSLQHKPVYTLGQAGKIEHLLAASDIPVIKTDRGGQITYHGPGQIVVYMLLDLKRRQLAVRELVNLLETSIVELLEKRGIVAHTRKTAPGVYVTIAGKEHKLASLGLRVRRGCCYHGLALNLDMDLEPFTCINPCGYAGLPVTQLVDILPGTVNWQETEQQLIGLLQKKLV